MHFDIISSKMMLTHDIIEICNQVHKKRGSIMLSKALYYSLLAELLSLINLIYLVTVYQIALILLLHFVACLLVSLFLLNLLPARYRKEKFKAIGVLTLTGFLLYALGYAFVFILSIYLLRKQKEVEKKEINTLSMKEIFTERVISKGPIFGEAPLFFINNPEKSSSALVDKLSLILLESKDPKVIGTASKAISSSHDDLRLSASSALSKLERSIQEKIRELSETLEKKHLEQNTRAMALFDLAKCYYDLVYFRLVSDELKNYVLQKAEKCILQALSSVKLPEFYILLGKINLAKKNYDMAEECFLTAIDCIKRDNKFKEVPPLRYAPYLMEVYFEKRDFNRVKKLLMENTTYIKYPINPHLKFLAEFWGVADEGSSG